VPDFTAARPAHEAHFAHAERREVVVQHETLGCALAGLEQFDALLVIFGAKRGGNQRLCLPPGEQRRAVGARKHAGLDGDVANFVEGAAIGRCRFFNISSRKMRSLRASRTFAASSCCSSGTPSTTRFLMGGDARVAFQLGIFLGVQRVGQLFASCWEILSYSA
jgi:hypothetical protein